jgi:hypothetical protein
MNIADHVKRRKARNIIPEAKLKSMLMIALPKMKFIMPVNMDKANRTGSKIIFNISATPFC